MQNIGKCSFLSALYFVYLYLWFDDNSASKCIPSKYGIYRLIDQSNGFPLNDTYTHHDDVIKWKHYPRYWPFVRGFIGHRWITLIKAQRRGALIFFFICAWINAWVNNNEAGDLRCHRAHYDVIIMIEWLTLKHLDRWFQNAISVCGVVHCNTTYGLQLVKYGRYLINTMDNDGLVLNHRGISSHGADYAPMCFHVFLVWYPS